MNTKRLVGVAMFMAMVSLVTANYLSRGQGSFTYFGGDVRMVNAEDEVQVDLFNPSSALSLNYNLSISGVDYPGTLGPLASTSVTPVENGSLQLTADGDVSAWKKTLHRNGNDVTGLNTQAFQSNTVDGGFHLFPWIRAFSGGLFDSGYLTVINTSPFTADFNYELFDVAAGGSSFQQPISVGPFGTSIVPAASSFNCHDCDMYGLLYTTNGATAVASYTGQANLGAFSYWSEPTSAFSALFFRPGDSFGKQPLDMNQYIYGDSLYISAEEDTEEPAKQHMAAAKFGASSPFSDDHAIMEDASITSWFTVMNKERNTAFEGNAVGEFAQTTGFFNVGVTAPAPNIPGSLEGVSLVPGPGHYSGTLRFRTNLGFTPTSLAVYTVDGDRSTAKPSGNTPRRSVFPVDGREAWSAGLVGSAFVIHNKSDDIIPLAIVLLDELGDPLNIEYTELAPGAEETPVHLMLNGFPDARSVLFETAMDNADLNLHLMVRGTGAGYDASVVNHIAATALDGCSTFGAGYEHYRNWGSGHIMSCESRPASILGMIERINDGTGLPFPVPF